MHAIDSAIAALRGAALLKLGHLVVLLGCALAATELQPRRAHAAPSKATAVAEWPQRWDGRELRPLAPADVDRRFAARFPGTFARLTDGERQFVLRSVGEPTRMLHPAADCYRASGYRIDAMRLERDAAARTWRCFDAARGTARVRVCERIADGHGNEWTDTSAWFWAALLGRSPGPWLAMTTAEEVAR